MLRKWTPLDVFLPSLIPGSPCLGPPLLSWGWTTRKAVRSLGQKALLLCSPSARLIKNAFDKFDHDFQAANLPEGKYIKPPYSAAKLYKVGQPCYEDKIQELNPDFAKICITPKPSGAPMGKVPLPILKELEHQARQNISTLNFTAAFAKTSSSCNATLEKCQYWPVDIWTSGIRLFLFNTALTCLSKSLVHILQRELYTMGNPFTTTIRENEMPKT